MWNWDWLTAYGMNSNSRNKKLAWEFIKFMLGEEMQRSPNLFELPVNYAAYYEMSKRFFVTEPSEDGSMVITDEEFQYAYDEFIELFDGYVNKLTFLPITDAVIKDMVMKEAKLFFDGVKTAEEVADTLQNRVQLYLSE